MVDSQELDELNLICMYSKQASVRPTGVINLCQAISSLTSGLWPQAALVVLLANAEASSAQSHSGQTVSSFKSQSLRLVRNVVREVLLPFPPSTPTAVSQVWALAIAGINDPGKCYSFDMHFPLSESNWEGVQFYYDNTNRNEFVRVLLLQKHRL